MIRRGSCLVLGLILLVVLGAVTTVAWITALHWSHSKTFWCAPWDPAWWSPLTTKAKPAAEQAGALAAKTGSEIEERIWGEQGAVNQAEAWWNARQKAAPEPAPAPPPPAAQPAPAPPLIPSARAPQPPSGLPVRRVEAELARAEGYFSTGLDHYRQANPQSGATPAARADHLRAAASAFAQADNLLGTAIAEYRTIPEHSPKRLADVEALQRYNRSLFESTSAAEQAVEGY
jgi:hypothetical protein